MMKNIQVSICIMFILLFLMSCNGSITHFTSKNKPFNSKSTLLMTIPSGYEIGEARFSPDGYFASLILKKDGKAYVNINGSMSQAYDDVRDVVFAPNTKLSAFVARKGTLECVVVNGKENPVYDGIAKPLFTSENKLVYAARRKEKWCLVMDSKESKPFSSPDPSLFASPDGKRLAYIAINDVTKKTQLRVCNNDFTSQTSGADYDEISAIRNDFSRSHLVYRVSKDGKQTVVLFDFTKPQIVEKPNAWYDEVNKFTMSSDGVHVAFFAIKDKKIFLVKDGIEELSPLMDMTLDINIHRSGKTAHTGVIKNKVTVFIDSKANELTHETVEDMIISPDDLHYMYVGGYKNLYFTVIDGSKSLLYDKIVTPRFTPDSSEVVYRARTGGQRFVVVADVKTGQVLQEQPRYEAIWDVSIAPDSNTVGYGVKDGPELWWKVEKLKINTVSKVEHDKK